MKTPTTISLNLTSPMATLMAVAAFSLALPIVSQSAEDPPGCSLANGGSGAGNQNGMNFDMNQAHVGDDVAVIPTIGMLPNACRAINVTGSVYIATGRLTNCLDNVTLYPGESKRPRCIIHITSALVGAGINSLNPSIPGVPNTVKAVGLVVGTALTETTEELRSVHTASITIVNPAIQVVQQPDYPAGQTCFPAGANVQYSGYVTNAGDITLTNVTVMSDRSGQVQLLDPTSGQPLTGNVTLPSGAIARFAGSFTPTADETSAGSAANQLTATARDTTVIGGPNAAASHSTTTASSICGLVARPAALRNCVCLANGHFQFEVVGQADKTYEIQATTDLNSGNWATIGTVSKSPMFTDTNAASYPARFYRAVEQK